MLFLVRTTPQPSQNLVEPSWNAGGTLVELYLRAAPDHPERIWAETPKLSAVGEKSGTLILASLLEDLALKKLDMPKEGALFRHGLWGRGGWDVRPNKA